MERARVLIIEENRRIVGELHDRLVREGYETEVALNGEMGAPMSLRSSTRILMI